jgi:hypothetical protein
MAIFPGPVKEGSYLNFNRTPTPQSDAHANIIYIYSAFILSVAVYTQKQFSLYGNGSPRSKMRLFPFGNENNQNVLYLYVSNDI